MQIENSKLKIALVHDYLREYGGAERVLEALSELFPDAPIYTAFYQQDSIAYKKFKNKDIRVSWVHYIPFFASKLHSPLRFLAPLIWQSFDFSSYDVVITSAGWYVTKGVLGKGQKTNDHRPIEICYCHTPPRWLYGYPTSVEWQRYWPVQVYAAVVGHFMRMYDFRAAQRVDYFIANSEETKRRIVKFYRRDAKVIYPPVSLPSTDYRPQQTADGRQSTVDKSYYLTVSRIVGAKGIELAVKAAQNAGFKLKIAGVPGGYYSEYKNLHSLKNVEFLRYVNDEELVDLYSGAKAFLALATDEDFGITPVEAMLCGTPVIAYRGGGYVESVVDGKTGVFFDDQTVESLVSAMKKLENITIRAEDCIAQAKKFSKERFKKEIKEFINRVMLRGEVVE